MSNVGFLGHKSIYYKSNVKSLLLDLKTLEKYDRSGMHRVYDRWPELAEEYYKRRYECVDFRGIDHIIFTGMGGSGAIGDALAAILSKKKIHLQVVKGYHLPNTVDSRTLVVATSASGTTRETLTILKGAKKAGCKIVAFSSGGKMQDYCDKNRIEFRQIPVLNSPRASFPVYLYSILNVLETMIPVRKSDVAESLRLLKRTQRQIRSSNLHNNPSLLLSQWITGIPMIYYPMGLQAAAIRFKNSLQENAKTHAIAEDIIEACHNGIVSWERPSTVQPILIQGRDDYIKTKNLWEVVKDYFSVNRIRYMEVVSVQGNILSKIINLIYFLDYTTIYNAVTRKIDPTPIKSINFVKERAT